MELIAKHWPYIIAIIAVIATSAVALDNIETMSSRLDDISNKQEFIVQDVAFIRGKLEFCCISSTGSSCNARCDNGVVSFICCDQYELR